MSNPVQQQLNTIHTARPLEENWQLAHKPHEWQAILLEARRALHENPQDTEALEAIDQANEALSVYDEAQSGTWGQLLDLSRQNLDRTSGNTPDRYVPPESVTFDPDAKERVLQGLGGGLVGEGDKVLHTLVSLLRSPWTAANAIREAVRNPDQAIEDLNNAAFVGPANAIKDFVSRPGEVLGEATPKELGNAAMTGGMLLAPMARTDMTTGVMARGLSPGYGPFTRMPGPTVGGAIGRTLTRPFRAIGGWVGNKLDAPAIENAMNRANALRAEEEAGLAADRRKGVQMMNEQVISERGNQAKLRTGILGEQLGQQATKGSQLEERLRLLQQAVERGGPTAENLDLRNELLRLRIAMMQGGEGAADVGGSTGGLFENPQEIPDPRTSNISGPGRGISIEGPPLKPVSKADEAFSRMRLGEEAPPVPGDVSQPFQSPPFEEMGPNNQPFPISQKSKWPMASNFDIENWLRQIANASQSGYK